MKYWESVDKTERIGQNLQKLYRIDRIKKAIMFRTEQITDLSELNSAFSILIGTEIGYSSV